MRSFLFKVTLILFVLAAPTFASTWRSTSGNIFHFESNGTVILSQVGGRQLTGRWWWSQRGVEFCYDVGYGRSVVTLQGGGAICRVYGAQPEYWTQLSRRGENEAPAKAGEHSWFCPTESP